MVGRSLALLHGRVAHPGDYCAALPTSDINRKRAFSRGPDGVRAARAPHHQVMAVDKPGALLYIPINR